MIKKIVGYLLITIAIISTLLILFTAPKKIITIFNFFTSNPDNYQTGYAIGILLYWVFHLIFTIICCFFGLRLIKSKL